MCLLPLFFSTHSPAHALGPPNCAQGNTLNCHSCEALWKRSDKNVSLEVRFALIIGRRAGSKYLCETSVQRRLFGLESGEQCLGLGLWVQLLMASHQHTTNFYPKYSLPGFCKSLRTVFSLHPAVNSYNMDSFTKGRLCLFRVTSR